MNMPLSIQSKGKIMQITLNSQNPRMFYKPEPMQLSDLLLSTLSLIDGLQGKNLLFSVNGNRFTADTLLKLAIQGGGIEFLLCSSEMAKSIKQCFSVRRQLSIGILSDQEASQYLMAKTDSFKSWFAYLESFFVNTPAQKNMADRFIDELNCISDWQDVFMNEPIREGCEVYSWRHLLHINTVHQWLGSHFAPSSISDGILQIDKVAFSIRRLSQQLPGAVELTNVMQGQDSWHHVQLNFPCEMASDAFEELYSDFVSWIDDEISSGDLAIRVKRTFDVLSEKKLDGLSGVSKAIGELMVTVFGRKINTNFCSELETNIRSRIADELDAIIRCALQIRA